jgi:putative transcriptional regulator
VNNLRKWLKSIRVEKNLTHEDVAKNCNISRSYYTHIENGTKTPTVNVAKRIAEYLGFDWTIFFENKCSLKEHKTTA